jgi:uncharacterized repeat protein (TIGR03803 family)
LKYFPHKFVPIESLTAKLRILEGSSQYRTGNYSNFRLPPSAVAGPNLYATSSLLRRTGRIWALGFRFWVLGAGLLALALCGQRALGTAAVSVVASFSGTNGALAQFGVIQGTNGQLYGTTSSGGANGFGTVFGVSPSGVLTNLYSFGGGNDGANPQAALVLGSDGYLYGTTSGGGTNQWGTVFNLSPNGTFSSLYSFGAIQDADGDPLDGGQPEAPLVQDQNGNFYGTTYFGGATLSGSIFEIKTGGQITNLFTFNGSNEGAYPLTGLLLAKDGNLYGTTSADGASSGGTVYAISPSGAFTNLGSFVGTNGADPKGGLIQGTDSSLYGTTYSGGAGGAGTVFRLDAEGVPATFVSFDGIDNGNTEGGVIQAADGNFYGGSFESALHPFGTIFRVTPAGAVSTVAVFTNGDAGANPAGSLLQGSDGALYGTTVNGGAGGNGVVFRVTELPYLILQPVGQTNLTGESVVFQAAGGGGFGPLGYQWQFNGANIRGATSDVLSLTNATPAEAGIYTVVVTNAFGSVTSSNALLMVIPPSPMVAIISPAPGMLVTNPALTISGTASDNVPLAAVNYQLDGSSPESANTTDIWATWSANVTLAPGVNTIWVYCTDSQGAVSPTATVQVTYTPLSPFVPHVATYNGLFYDTNGVALESSGAFTLSTTSKGTFSGSLQFAGGRYTMKGTFDTNGSAQILIGRGSLPPVTLSLQVDRVPASGQLYGWISSDGWTADLAGDQAFFDGRENIATQAGPYTAVVAGDPANATVPIGAGYGTVTVGKTGHLRLAAVLADGTKLSQGATLSRSGHWPLFAPLYGGRGLLLSWVTFTNAGGGTAGASSFLEELYGELVWIKPHTKAKYYANGFDLEATLVGSRYIPPPDGGNVLAFTNGLISLIGGNLVPNITNSIALLAGGKASVQGLNDLRVSFRPSTGFFSGTAANPSAPLLSAPIPFSGVVLQAQNSGYGFFLGTNLSGGVVLAPSPP